MNLVNYDGLYNKEFYGDRMTKNHFYDKKLSFRIIEDGTILPHKIISVDGKIVHLGGLLDSQLNFIDGTSVHNGIGGRYTPNEEISVSSETVIFLGTFNTTVWGHCLTDDLQRIWFLQDAMYKKYFKNLPLLYLSIEKGGGMIPNLIKLFKILEVDIQRLRFVNRATKFKTIIMPDSSFFTGMFSREYIETINRVRDFAFKYKQPISQKKFYFFYGQGKQIGEERIALYFQSKGYTIIQPEKYSLEDQLNILANCESFASTAGSCSHNIIFMKNDSEIILIPRYNSLNSYQEALNETHSQNIFYVDSMLSIFVRQPEFLGPFCYIVSENLRKYFGEEITAKYADDDFITFLQYVFHCKTQGLKENLKEMEYLKNILPEFISQLKTRQDLMQRVGIFLK